MYPAGNFYVHKIKACVPGSNLQGFSGKTVEECKEVCDKHADCLAFEFGVAHGGSSPTNKPGDCRPKSSADACGCDGAHFNTDLYIKKQANGDELFVLRS